MQQSKIAKFAWFVLYYNIVVVVWGVFLRASKSGDGCGQYWLTCNGEILPTAPQLKTVIEFSHRLMSGLDFLIVLALFVLVLRNVNKPREVRFFAGLSFVFIITEALIGAGLVLTGNVAESYSDSRPFWAIGHLINTFLLLGSLAVTASLLSSKVRLALPKDSKTRVVAAGVTLAIVFVGITGSVAALSNMLFPSASFGEAITKDFDPDSHILLRLRILHPIGSILVSALLVFAAGWIRKIYGSNAGVTKFARAVVWLIGIQVVFGAVTLLKGAPILMQLGHLLLADLVWIAWMLLLTSVFAKPEIKEVSA